MLINFCDIPFIEYLDVEIISRSKHPLIFNCINAWSFYSYYHNPDFKQAVLHGINLIDGAGIAWGASLLNKIHIHRITGFDLMLYMLKHSDLLRIKKVLLLGSSENVLSGIKKRIIKEFPDLEYTFYSPPYKNVFDSMDIDQIYRFIQSNEPDLIFIGLSAPKQEIISLKLIELNSSAKYFCNIGAAFDFYAGTESRAPFFLQKIGLEGLFRTFLNPVKHLKKDIKSYPFLFKKILQYKIYGK